MVTSTHRVWARRHSGPPQSVKASVLRTGDIAFVGRGCAEALLHVEAFRHVADMADITFPGIKLSRPCIQLASLVRATSHRPDGAMGRGDQLIECSLPKNIRYAMCLYVQAPPMLFNPTGEYTWCRQQAAR